MTQLEIKLHQPQVEGFLDLGAVVTVRLLADLDGKTIKEWWSQAKPIAIAGGSGDQGEPTVFELPRGGHYGVDITRPRGPDISYEFLVTDGENRAEMITMKDTPHEYLGWQQYAGIVRSAPYQKEIVGKGLELPSIRSKRFYSLMKKSKEKVDNLYSQVRSVPKVFAAEVPASTKAWQLVTDATQRGEREWATAIGSLDWVPAYEEEYATWFREMPDNEEGIKLIQRLMEKDPPADECAAKFPRWITIETGGQIDLASVPWPWWGATRHKEEVIRFLYDRVRASSVDHDLPGRFTISVQDRRWFGLLEFLASGRLNRTGDMFNHILTVEHESVFSPEIALYGKVKGPLVAVAGAIVLIARAESNEHLPWDQWLGNLSRWFPGIPDGPILLGCRRVAQAKSLDELTQAFQYLHEGISRGIPFFSASIQMLTMALAQIGSDVPAAEKDRRFVAPVSTRVDPDQPFTVIRL